MKKAIVILICVLMLLSTTVFPVTAAEAETGTTVEYLPDGSYIVTVIEEQDTHGARTNTKVGSKTRSYYSSENILRWKMTVTGEFQYDGTTSCCTYASGVTTVYNTTLWQVTSESATTGDTTAYYSVTFARWALGVVIERPTYGVSLTCDQNGNLS